MADMHEWVIAFILGVVEGLTEFLPVSSTGHMILVGSLLGFTDDKAKTFEVIIQLGSILAVVLGLVFHEQIKAIFAPIYVMYALVVGGVLLLAGEWLKPKVPRAAGIDDLTYLQAFLIGCFQCLALWPGFSRSGATISGGLLVGVSRYAASGFSFILAVPMMLGATVLDLYKSLPFLAWQDFPVVTHIC